jgi:hypothetical protein
LKANKRKPTNKKAIGKKMVLIFQKYSCGKIQVRRQKKIKFMRIQKLAIFLNFKST